MTSVALRPVPRRVARPPLARRRRRRLRLDAELLSVAGVVGSPVHDGSGRLVGMLDDLVVRWDTDDPHPPVVGAVVRGLRKRTFVPVEAFAELRQDGLRLTATLEPHPPERKPGLVALAHDVLDRQIVDVDGADVARVSDLVVAQLPDGLRLVGSDVSMRTLLRRLGPASWRRRVAPGRVYDWAAVAAFSERGAGDAGSVMHLTRAAAELRQQGPTVVDDLAADLPPNEGNQLKGSPEPAP